MQDTGQVTGEHLLFPSSRQGTKYRTIDHMFSFHAESSDTAKFSRVPIVLSEVPTRRKPIPMTSTDEEEEERATKERETCSRRGGDGGRRQRTGLHSHNSDNTDDVDIEGRRRRRR